MSGFGYFLSHKTTKIMHDSLSEVEDEIAFNLMEDTFMGHVLATFDVEFVDIGKVVQAYPKPTVSSLNNQVIDHWYKSKSAKEASLMVQKYEMHCRLHRDYLSNSGRGKMVSVHLASRMKRYSPKLLL